MSRRALGRLVRVGLLVGLLVQDATALPVEGRRGMVSSAHRLATEAGVELLRAGGNAVDAAVATAFALAVVEPVGSGLGGGGFALVQLDAAPRFLDFRERAPAAATPDMFVQDGVVQPELSRDGALAAGVPGAVAGYLELHARHGRLPRKVVLSPAIRLARKGFAVDERYRESATRRRPQLAADPEAARIFLRQARDGSWQVPAWGTVLVQEALARTLEDIARSGADGFYRGRVGALLASDMARRGGRMTAADLRAYRPRWMAPRLGRFRGHAVATAPLPSAGGHVVLSMLAALEPFAAERPLGDPEVVEAYLAAARQAAADRLLLGDPAFVADPTAELGESSRLERARSLQLSAERPGEVVVVPGAGSRWAAQADVTSREAHNTSHLCVVDAEGRAVSMTTTINDWFGAAIVAAGTGVLWNNEMDDFAAAAGAANTWGAPGGVANVVAPGKAPLSSMSPTIVYEGPTAGGPVRLVVGAPGGPRIPLQVALAIDAHLRRGENVQLSLASPKLLHPWWPDVVQLERGALDPLTRRHLEQRGWKLAEEADHRRWGNGTAIAIDPASGLRTGAADPRGHGVALAE